METASKRDIPEHFVRNAQSRVVPAGGKRLGLVVGIDTYAEKSFHALQAAAADATAMWNLMVDEHCGTFDRKHTIRLLNEEATSTSIRKALGHLTTHAEAQDEVWIFFAGHGVQAGKQHLLVPVDATRQDIKYTGIPPDLLSQIPGRRRLVFLDCCHSGAANLVTRGSGDLQQALGAYTGSGCIAFCSSAADQKSLELEREKRGLFTYWLERGLRGEADEDRDGVVSDEELWRFVCKKVTDHAKDLREEQLPQKLSNVGGGGFGLSINISAWQTKAVEQERAAQFHRLLQDLLKEAYDELKHVIGDADEVLAAEDEAGDRARCRQHIQEELTNFENDPQRAKSYARNIANEIRVLRLTTGLAPSVLPGAPLTGAAAPVATDAAVASTSSASEAVPPALESGGPAAAASLPATAEFRSDEIAQILSDPPPIDTFHALFWWMSATAAASLRSESLRSDRLPDHVPVHLSDAVQALADHDYASAAELFRRAMRDHDHARPTGAPDIYRLSHRGRAVIQLTRGVCQALLGEWGKAILDWTSIIKAYDDHPAHFAVIEDIAARARIWRALALVQSERGTAYEAAEDCASVLDWQDLALSDRLSALLVLGLAFEKLALFDKAEAEYTKVVQTAGASDEHIACAKLLRGKIFLAKGDKSAAIRDHRAVVDLDVKPPFFSIRALYLLAALRPEQAETYLSDVFALTRDAQRSGKFAVVHLDTPVQIEVLVLLDVHMRLAAVCAQRRNPLQESRWLTWMIQGWGGSVSAISNALNRRYLEPEVLPNVVTSLMERARCEAPTNRAEWYAAALGLRGVGSSEIAGVGICRALASFEAGQTVEACTELEAIIDGGSTPPSLLAKALIYLGMLWAMRGKPKTALRKYREAREVAGISDVQIFQTNILQCLAYLGFDDEREAYFAYAEAVHSTVASQKTIAGQLLQVMEDLIRDDARRSMDWLYSHLATLPAQIHDIGPALFRLWQDRGHGEELHWLPECGDFELHTVAIHLSLKLSVRRARARFHCRYYLDIFTEPEGGVELELLWRQLYPGDRPGSPEEEVARALNRRGALALIAGKDVDAAVNNFNEVIQRADSPDREVAVAFAYRGYASYVSQLRRMIAANTPLMLRDNHLGKLHEPSGQKEFAQDMEFAAARDSTAGDVAFCRALALLASGEDRLAMDAYVKAAECFDGKVRYALELLRAAEDLWLTRDRSEPIRELLGRFLRQW